jgi:hypothetical protein
MGHILMCGDRQEPSPLQGTFGWLRGVDLNHRPLGYAPKGSMLSPVESIALPRLQPPNNERKDVNSSRYLHVNLASVFTISRGFPLLKINGGPHGLDSHHRTIGNHPIRWPCFSRRRILCDRSQELSNVFLHIIERA